MVKFSKGMWHAAPDTDISWGQEIVKAEASKDSIRAVLSSKIIRHRGDTLNNPTITIQASSPAPDVLLLDTYHWKAQKPSLNGPNFELFPNLDTAELTATRQDNVQTLKTEKELTLSTNTLTATFNTTPQQFNFDIKARAVHNPTVPSKDGEVLLTRLGWRSVGYIIKNGSSHPNDQLDDPERGTKWITLQFHLSVGEKIYGLGERFGPFIKNGQEVQMWNEDGGTSSELTYKNVPFFISSRGYGVLVSNPGFISFEVQSERTSRLNIALPFEGVPVYLIHGPTPAEILNKFTRLIGRPALPPPWTFGLWLTTSFTTDYDEKTIDHFLSGMDERDIPLQTFHFDCFWMKGFQWCDFEFDEKYFPDPKAQLKRMKDKGYKICVWINSYIAQESSIFDEGVEGGYFIKKSDGSVWQYDAWQAGMALVDFTNPEACKWYQSKLKTLIDLGVDSFKTDFGERIPTGNVVYHDGSNVNKMHNYYAFLYNKVVFELLEKELGKNQAALFARSATAGGGRFPVHWGGDPMSTFEAMAETLRGGLSLGLCGFGYWAHDIGGFEGKPDPALYRRWFAFGSLSSHSRLHGSGSYRVPWVLDPSGESDAILRKFIHLKLSLMPYLYTTAVSTHKTGSPMMRPIFFEFPEDPSVWNLDTQYLLGPNLMIAPVFNAEGFVTLYIPQGSWYGLLDEKIRKGPGYVNEIHGFDSIPLLLRPGSAIVMGHEKILDGRTRRGPVYDWTEEVTVVINNIDEQPLELEVSIADEADEKLGEVKTVLKVLAVDSQVGITVEVVSGILKGKWKVKYIGKDGVVTEKEAEEGATKVSI
ncbi:alpha-glucosidase II [Flagelloscypha sp. PMI_526]|nr:alpha-glucosidase II [Flagelloscypha sp. PMI_526]